MNYLRMSIGLGCLVLFGHPALLGADFTLEPGFTRLDNGKDLTGWKGKVEGWSVVDGAIHLDSRKAKSSLYAEKLHSGDCIIRLEFRAAAKADSGVYVWGKQLQVRDYPTAGPKQYAAHARPAREWNQLEFVIKAGVAEVRLNGKVIEQNWKLGTKKDQGLGLQKERGDFDFRYIRLKETGSN